MILRWRELIENFAKSEVFHRILPIFFQHILSLTRTPSQGHSLAHAEQSPQQQKQIEPLLVLRLFFQSLFFEILIATPFE